MVRTAALEGMALFAGTALCLVVILILGGRRTQDRLWWIVLPFTAPHELMHFWMARLLGVSSAVVSFKPDHVAGHSAYVRYDQVGLTRWKERLISGAPLLLLAPGYLCFTVGSNSEVAGVMGSLLVTGGAGLSGSDWQGLLWPEVEPDAEAD